MSVSGRLDPLPGDFDEELEAVDPRDIEIMEPSRERRLVVHFTVDGPEAETLSRLAESQGKSPSVVVRSLIRAASGRAA